MGTHHHHGTHNHGHQNAHHHHHGHHGATGNLRTAFFLNLIFTILELFGGLWTNSMAIISDALHDLGDSLSLGLAWYLEGVAAKDRDQQFSYGYARFSVLGAFINSVILIAGGIYILYETIPRLLAPESPDVKGMLFFAVVGVTVNGAAALRLSKGKTLNERAVMLHLMEDVLGWVAILIGSVVMLFVDVPILDPILSLMIMVFVLFNVGKNLKLSFRIFLQGTPREINVQQLQAEVEALPDVEEVHDLHVWTLDGSYNVASLHVAIRGAKSLLEAESIKTAVREHMLSAGIEHCTIEVEDSSIECGGCEDLVHDH